MCASVCESGCAFVLIVCFGDAFNRISMMSGGTHKTTILVYYRTIAKYPLKYLHRTKGVKKGETTGKMIENKNDGQVGDLVVHRAEFYYHSGYNGRATNTHNEFNRFASQPTH